MDAVADKFHIGVILAHHNPAKHTLLHSSEHAWAPQAATPAFREDRCALHLQ